MACYNKHIYGIRIGKGGGHSWVYRSVVGFSRYFIKRVRLSPMNEGIVSGFLFVLRYWIGRNECETNEENKCHYESYGSMSMTETTRRGLP